MDKAEDFLQHWGVKGMKWDDDKKEKLKNEVELKKNQAKYQIKDKVLDVKGIFNKKGQGKERLVNELELKKNQAKYQIKDKAIDVKKIINNTIGKQSHSMSTNIKNISSDTIKKGQSFIDSIASRVSKIGGSHNNAINTKNIHNNITNTTNTTNTNKNTTSSISVKGNLLKTKSSSKSNRLDLVSSIKSISSDSVKKGKVFLDKFLIKGPDRSTVKVNSNNFHNKINTVNNSNKNTISSIVMKASSKH